MSRKYEVFVTRDRSESCRVIVEARDDAEAQDLGIDYVYSHCDPDKLRWDASDCTGELAIADFAQLAGDDDDPVDVRWVPAIDEESAVDRLADMLKEYIFCGMDVDSLLVRALAHAHAETDEPDDIELMQRKLAKEEPDGN